jgi:transposase
MVPWPPARGRGPGGQGGGPSPRSTSYGSSRSTSSWTIRERGALLRREGLYTSHISEWRKARDKGAAGGLAEKTAGRPGRSTAEAENERQRKENEKLAAELARTKAALEVVGKAHALLELLSESADSDAKRRR